MWLNKEKVDDTSIRNYRQLLLSARPNHVIIDGLFNEAKLAEVLSVLHKPQRWETQKHTYDSLYVDDTEWLKTNQEERFVKRDIWLRDEMESSAAVNLQNSSSNVANDFLSFLRNDDFMSLLSRIFNVTLTDMNVADPNLNTNYFRLSASDFVEQHADDSPGREVCMLLYLNKGWESDLGGELVFLGENQKSVSISPLFNRCVLFDPSSQGSEHWVNKLKPGLSDLVRYNVTSWYWSK